MGHVNMQGVSKHRGHSNIQDACKHCSRLKSFASSATHMGSTKHTMDIQTYGGIKTLQQARKVLPAVLHILGHPNIQQGTKASKHMGGASKHTGGASKHMGASKHTRGVQT